MPAPRPSGPPLNPKFIFNYLGITDATPWEETSPARIVLEMIESAALDITELSKILCLHPRTVNTLITTANQESIKPVLDALKPELEKLRHIGWLDPESLAINAQRCENIAKASIALRKQRGLSYEKMLAITKEENIPFIDATRLERNTSSKRLSLKFVMTTAERMCRLYKMPLDELISQGAAAPALPDLDESEARFGEVLARIRSRRNAGHDDRGAGERE